MRIFHALINLSMNCFLNNFLSDSVKITWCVFDNNVFLSVSANEDLSASRLGNYLLIWPGDIADTQLYGFLLVLRKPMLVSFCVVVPQH